MYIKIQIYFRDNEKKCDFKVREYLGQSIIATLLLLTVIKFAPLSELETQTLSVTTARKYRLRSCRTIIYR